MQIADGTALHSLRPVTLQPRSAAWNMHANDLEVMRAVLCAGLFPNVVAVKNGKRRFSL